VHIDLWFAAAPAAETRLEIVDARNQVIRSYGVSRATAAGAGQEMRGPGGRGGGGASGIRPEAGMQRFVWDMRHGGAGGAGGGGPMVPPGKYTARLTSGGQTQTKTFELQIDPRVARDGVTQADLEEQTAFLLRIRDAIAEARRLQQQVEESMKKAGVAPVGAAVPGSTPLSQKFAHPLQALWARLADQPGIYPQPMLIAQLSNVQRMVGSADQKIGKDAVDRFNDLLKELQAAQAEFKQIG
jgi:hypothetical protein